MSEARPGATCWARNLPQPVNKTLAFSGLYRYPDGKSIEVGENADGQGVVATPQLGAIAVPGTGNLESVSCATATTCWAAGLATVNSDQAVLVKVVNGQPTTVKRLPTFYGLYGIACPTASTCFAVGYVTANIADAVTTITNGVAATPVEVAGGEEWLDAISCVNATQCDAVGLVNYNASIVPIVSGARQTAITLPDSWYVNGIDCTSVGSCVMVGESGNTGQGAVYTLVNGVAGTTQLVPGTENLYGAGCAFDGKCLLNGASQVGVTGYSHGVLVRDNGGDFHTVQGVANTNGFGEVACGASLNDCTTVGAAIK